MIVTNDPTIAAECRSLRNLCFQPQKRFVHERLGWNLRMTNIQAAVGVAQIQRLDEFIERKRRMGRRYTELLSDLRNVQLPLAKTDFAENCYWVYGLVLHERAGMDAEDVMRRLAAIGVGTRPFFCPMNLQPVLRRMGLFAGETYPVAENLYRQGFYIPSGLALTDEQMEEVARKVREILS